MMSFCSDASGGVSRSYAPAFPPPYAPTFPCTLAQTDGTPALSLSSTSLGLRSETRTRWARLNTEFMVFGLLMLSDATREVSTVPGGWLSRTCQTKLSFGRRCPNTPLTRRYCAPMLPEMFSHLGLALSVGGLSGWNEAWQKAQLMPTRKGRTRAGSPTPLE